MNHMDVNPDPLRRHGFAAFVARRPVAVTMLVLAVLVFGLVSLGRLPLTLMPDISYPRITLRTTWEGAAPEEVEQFVSRPIEEAMGVVAGKVSITSLSRAGQSDVVVEFGWDTDLNLSIQDLREKLETVRLPDDAERPLILRYDPSLDPVLRVGLAWSDGAGGEADLRRLRLLAEEQVKRELEMLPGVAAVKVKGGLEEEIRVELDEGELALRGLDIQALSRKLAAENVNLAGGNLQEGRSEYVVRVLSEFRSLEDIADTRVRAADGAELRLGDLATVRRVGKDAETLTRVNGIPAVEVEIHKEADANVVRVAESLRKRLFGPGRTEWRADSAAAPAKEARPARGGHGPGGGPGPMGPEPLAGRLAGQGVNSTLLADQSTFIRGSLDELRGNALTGGLLAVVILLLFLRSLAPTGIVALTIPLSIVATFGPMQLGGLSLNVMSLGGLALGVGMLVDNAIVVLESIHRCRQAGDDRLRAAVRGTGEVAQAVTASTLTTLAVFFPMVFVEGVAGQVFGDLALVVVFSLSASLVFALTFIPMLAALGAGEDGGGGEAEDDSPLGAKHLVRPLWAWTSLRADRQALAGWRGRGGWWRGPVRVAAWLGLLLRLPVHAAAETALRLIQSVVMALGWLARRITGLWSGLAERLAARAAARPRSGRSLAQGYERLLRRVLTAPAALLCGVVLLALLSLWLLPGLGRELMPELHQGEFHVEAELPVGTPLERTAERLRPVEEFLKAQPEVAGTALVVGADTQGGIDADGGEHVARLTVRLREGGDPVADEEALLKRLRPLLAQQPDLRSRVGRPVLFSYQTPLEVQIQGHDLAALREGARRAEEALGRVPGLADLHSTSGGGNPEIHVRFRREELARLGLDLQAVGNLLRQKVLGGVDTEFRDVEQRVDIRVRLRPEDVLGLEDIRGLVVNPGGAVPVPLAAVAEVALSEGPSEIRRLEQERTVLVRANLAGRDLGGAVEEVRGALAGVDWPEGLEWEVSGQSREMQRSLSSLYLALALAIFLVYVVMASQFESLLHPFIILAAVPLAFLGVVPVLKLLAVPMSVLVFLGAILLVGIVVNNAILLVDTVNLFRGEGLERREAVVQAGRQRLRPILMTTLTTVLGLLPLALGLGDGAELRRPMALTVIAGLSASTLLTLVVVPVLYEQAEDGLAALRRLLGSPRRRGGLG